MISSPFQKQHFSFFGHWSMYPNTWKYVEIQFLPNLEIRKFRNLYPLPTYMLYVHRVLPTLGGAGRPRPPPTGGTRHSRKKKEEKKF
jgi:hypothetical protein